LEEDKKKAQEAIDKARALTQRLDSMLKLAETADSIQPLNFHAVCFYQLRYKDQSVTRDTAYLITNLNKDVINQKDYYKYE